jgi:hypothetical protein
MATEKVFLRKAEQLRPAILFIYPSETKGEEELSLFD